MLSCWNHFLTFSYSSFLLYLICTKGESSHHHEILDEIRQLGMLFVQDTSFVFLDFAYANNCTRYMFQKLAEMAEVLQARETKLVQMSKDNHQLMEDNSILRKYVFAEKNFLLFKAVFLPVSLSPNMSKSAFTLFFLSRIHWGHLKKEIHEIWVNISLFEF